MYYNEIYKQTEPGSAFLECLAAQTLKISLLSVNHGGTFVGSISVPVCQKKSGYITADSYYLLLDGYLIIVLPVSN